MIGVDINPALQSYFSENGYDGISITPLTGYRDSPAPFVTWEESTSTRNSEQFWLRESALTYYVYDTDLSRAKDIIKVIEDFLHVGDEISPIKARMTSPVYRLCWCRMANGGMFSALEREGFSSVVRSFEVGYLEI